MRPCARWRAAFAVLALLSTRATAQAPTPAAPPDRSADTKAAPAAPTPPAAQPATPEETTGIDRAARRVDEVVRTVGNAALWPLRLVLELMILAPGAAGKLHEHEQIVPRARHFYYTRGGEIGVFPTIFLETGFRPNIDARLITSIDPYAATVRGGYGAPEENVFETRMRLS